MTIDQAAALRLRWKGRADLSSDCKHLKLELEWDTAGHLTGHYTCVICGKPVTHEPGASDSRRPTISPAADPLERRSARASRSSKS